MVPGSSAPEPSTPTRVDSPSVRVGGDAMDSSSSTSTEIREMLSPDPASADEERSMVQAVAPVWASIGDGNPRQTICGEEVDFLAYPDWFLSILMVEDS